MPGAPTFVVDTTIVGGVLRKIQTRYAVLAKPTRVAKLIRTSKNFSTLCILPMMPVAPESFSYGHVDTLRRDNRGPTADTETSCLRGEKAAKSVRTYSGGSSRLYRSSQNSWSRL